MSDSVDDNSGHCGLATGKIIIVRRWQVEMTKTSINWQAQDLLKEWRRFKQHCKFTFKGPLAGKSEVEKVNYLMTYIGDKGREIYHTFEWLPARRED